MATADQIKALIKTHAEGDDARFYSIAMQVAAQEARQGHGRLAQELTDAVDAAKERARTGGRRTPMVAVSKEMGEVLAVGQPGLHLADMVLPDEIRARLQRILRENRQQAKLNAHALSPRRKLLLTGPPGSGKTMTAAVLAGELHLPLFTVRLEGLITKYLGETAAKLRLVFEAMVKARGVYFFDEFDSIGGQRALANDVGEARRILSSFLQLLEQDDSTGLIVAATNHMSLLDSALFRRFDDVLEYGIPGKDLVKRLITSRLAAFPTPDLDWDGVLVAAEGLSCAELAAACDDAAKDMILADAALLETADLARAMDERRTIRR